MIKERTRDKLITAAQQIFYEQGVQRTTLADIAHAAAIPLGNVYYHFRTKDALIEAVINARAHDLSLELAHYERAADPHQRLRALAEASQGDEIQLARYGCPYATLCQDIVKDGSALGEQAAGCLHSYVVWAERQFELLGRAEASHDLAIELIAKIQGSYLLAYAYRSPELLTRQSQRTVAWLEQIR